MKNVDQVAKALSQHFTPGKIYFGDPSGEKLIDMINAMALQIVQMDAYNSCNSFFSRWLYNHHEEPCLTCCGLTNKDACPDCGGTGSFWCDSDGEMRTLAEMQAAYQIQRARK